MRQTVLTLLLACLLPALAAAQTGVTGRTLSIGAQPTPPDGSTVRLTGLLTSGGTGVLLTDAEGDVITRVLAPADIPSQFTRRDVAEAISSAWTFGAGLTSNGAVQVNSTLGITGLATFSGGQVRGGASGLALRNAAHSADILTVDNVGSGTFAGLLRPGTATLPAGTGSLTLEGSTGSPVSGRIYIGDRTGWRMHLSTRASSSTVDRFTFHDTGRFEFAEHLHPLTNYTSDAGAPSRKLRTIHGAELFLESIVAQQRITTMGGRLTVAPSNVLTRDMDASTTTMCVKHNSFLLHVASVELGSKVWLERDGQFEVMSITNQTVPSAQPEGDYCYGVNRNWDGTGANAWAAGDGIIDTGKIGSGMIDQFAVRGLTAATIEGPSIDFLERVGHNWNELAQRMSIGNLNGRYGYSSDIYGLAAGNYSADHFTVETANGIRFRRATTVWAQLSSAGLQLGPTGAGLNNFLADASGNLVLRTGTTPKVTLAASTGSISLTGSLTVGTAGSISSGATAYGTGTGYWLEHNSGTPRFYIGNGVGAGNNYMTWSGSAMAVAGSLIATNGVQIIGNSGSGSLFTGTLSTLAIANQTVGGIVSLAASGGIQIATTSAGGYLIPSADGTGTIGTSGRRWMSAHFQLPNETAPNYVVVGNASVDNTRLAYIVGFTGTKVAGSCTLTLSGGVVTNITGC